MHQRVTPRRIMIAQHCDYNTIIRNGNNYIKSQRATTKRHSWWGSRVVEHNAKDNNNILEQHNNHFFISIFFRLHHHYRHRLMLRALRLSGAPNHLLWLWLLVLHLCNSNRRLAVVWVVQQCPLMAAMEVISNAHRRYLLESQGNITKN